MNYNDDRTSESGFVPKRPRDIESVIVNRKIAPIVELARQIVQDRQEIEQIQERMRQRWVTMNEKAVEIWGIRGRDAVIKQILKEIGDH